MGDLSEMVHVSAQKNFTKKVPPPPPIYVSENGNIGQHVSNQNVFLAKNVSTIKFPKLLSHGPLFEPDSSETREISHLTLALTFLVWVDAFLPFYTVFSGEPLFDYWFHWYLGDMPRGLTDFLRNCQLLGNGQIACNGLYQGALQYFHERTPTFI